MTPCLSARRTAGSEARRRHVDPAIRVLVLTGEHPDEQLHLGRADELARPVPLALDDRRRAHRVDAFEVDAEVTGAADAHDVPVAVHGENVGDGSLEADR